MIVSPWMKLVAAVMDLIPKAQHYQLSEGYYKASFDDFTHPEFGEGCWELLFVQGNKPDTLQITLCFLDVDGERFDEDNETNFANDVPLKHQSILDAVEGLLPHGRILTEGTLSDETEVK
jgi:hypothetical protein